MKTKQTKGYCFSPFYGNQVNVIYTSTIKLKYIGINKAIYTFILSM